MASPVTDPVVMSPNPVTEVLLFHLFSSNKSLTQSQILGAQSVPPDRTYFLPGGGGEGSRFKMCEFRDYCPGENSSPQTLGGSTWSHSWYHRPPFLRLLAESAR